MEFITWNNRPGQAEGEETSNLRRVATTEVLIHGAQYYIEIQSKLTGNTTKAYRVTSDLPEFISNWAPTLSSARQTAVQWASEAVQTKAQNILGMQWWIGVAALPVGKVLMPTVIGGYADTTRGRISVTRNGTGSWQVARTNDLTWETEPTVTGELLVYTETLWDAVATAAAWLKSKQEEHDAALNTAMLAVAKADAEAAALVRAEADAQWAREVDAEQKASLARGDLALAIANEEDVVVQHLLTIHPALQQVADAAGYVAKVPVAALPVTVRADGKPRGSNHGWSRLECGSAWIKVYRKLGTGASDWAVSITIKVEDYSERGEPLSWRVVITETVRNNTTCNDDPFIRMEATQIRTKTAAQKWGEEHAAKYVQWNRGRDRIHAALDKSNKAS
jgi:hypothetical protein